MTNTKTGIEKAREVAEDLKKGQLPEKNEEEKKTAEDIVFGTEEEKKKEEAVIEDAKKEEAEDIKKEQELEKKEEKPEVVETKIQEVETVMPAEIDKKTGQLILTEKHRQLIKEQIAPDATKEELELFFMMAYRTRLDPLLKQLYFIKYRDKYASEKNGCQCGWSKCTCGKSVFKVSYVTSIDGYRIIAHRTGLFDGVDEPEYKYDERVSHNQVEKRLLSCTVRVYKKGSSHAFAATVKFSEYDTQKNLWKTMPETMIAKVAEAHALRKAFPQDLSGIYTQDEMEQAGHNQEEKKMIEKPSIPMVTKSQVATVRLLIKQKEIPVEDVKQMTINVFKKDTMMKLTQAEAERLIAELKKLPDPDEAEQPNDEIDVDEVDRGIAEMQASR